MRKAVAVSITGEFFQAIFTEGWEAEHVRCISGLPEGARFAGSYAKQWVGTGVLSVPLVVLIFEHPDFAPVKDGGVIPPFDPEWRKYTKAEWQPKA